MAVACCQCRVITASAATTARRLSARCAAVSSAPRCTSTGNLATGADPCQRGSLGAAPLVRLVSPSGPVRRGLPL
jgi:hypothetical protein